MTPSFRDITPRLFAIPAWSTSRGEWVGLLHPEDADDWLDREFRMTGTKFPADMKPDGALHEPGHVYLSFQREDSEEIEAIVMLMAGQDQAGIAIDLSAVYVRHDLQGCGVGRAMAEAIGDEMGRRLDMDWQGVPVSVSAICVSLQSELVCSSLARALGATEVEFDLMFEDVPEQEMEAADAAP